MKKCDYKDYNGNEIKDGDKLKHPNGDEFIAKYDGNYIWGNWRAVYKNGDNMLLRDQIYENGRAVLIN